MGPVLSLPRKRKRESEADFNMCIICQVKRSPYTSAKGQAATKLMHTDQGVNILKVRASDREKYNDEQFIDCLDDLQLVELDNGDVCSTVK